jgi:hypothetical protein
MAEPKYIRRAVHAHTNLNTFGSVVTLLEGGHVYGGNSRTDRVVSKIIKLCQEEQQRLLREFDAACDDAPSPAQGQSQGGER